jgi:hypothetical protein
VTYRPGDWVVHTPTGDVCQVVARPLGVNYGEVWVYGPWHTRPSWAPLTEIRPATPEEVAAAQLAQTCL